MNQQYARLFCAALESIITSIGGTLPVVANPTNYWERSLELLGLLSNSFASTFTRSLDPVVQAFQSTGVDATTLAACDALVKQLKADGVWTKLREFGVFVGATDAAVLTRLLPVGTSLARVGSPSLSYSAAGLAITNIANGVYLEGGTRGDMLPTDFALGAYVLATHSSGVIMGLPDAEYLQFQGLGISRVVTASLSHPLALAANTVRMEAGNAFTTTRWSQITSNPESPIASSAAYRIFNFLNGGSQFPAVGLRLGAYWLGKALTAANVAALSNALDDFHFAIGRKAALNAVMFGDSITAGMGASATANRWSSRLAASLGITEINSGIGGTVLQNTDSLANNGRDRYVANVLGNRPWRTYILYGLNDLNSTNANLTVALYQNDLIEILQGLIAAGMAPRNIIVGSPPFFTNYTGGSVTKQQQYADAARVAALSNGCGFVDVYRAMRDGGGSALLDGDGVHPNDAGHTLIASLFAAYRPS